jgi:hypothetical protein
MIVPLSYSCPNVCRSLSKVRAGPVWQIIAGPVNKRGDGSVRRCGLPRHGVYCVRRGIRRSGGVVRGRLRRPYRPLQVIGVLAAVLPIARKSLRFSRSAECAGKLPIPAQVNLATSGERLHANHGPGPLGRAECEPVFNYAAMGRLSYEFVTLQPTKSTIGGNRRILCAIGA